MPVPDDASLTGRIAVVTGAWHSPALGDLSDAKGDTALLKGLKRIKTQATWIPWTNSRLAYRSGYGAGVASPGWYDHLWHHPSKAGLHWSAQVARLLRKEGLDASSASVIETVRLSEALAAMRQLPMAGLAELNEAAGDNIGSLDCNCSRHHLIYGLDVIRRTIENGAAAVEVHCIVD